MRTISITRGTFHRSKGLGADLILLLDDALPPEPHPLRTHMFASIPLLQEANHTYTQTMTDEARRLAYVALTRARLGAMWAPLLSAAKIWPKKAKV
ncbi:3'-5' exonuclease [Ktedonospora formicarum]|nr:3'-5' exonuclease [Ktedonospora formicarum]